MRRIPSLFVLFCAPVWSQTSQGNLTGSVTDPSAAVIPDATIQVANSAAGLVRTTVSTASGLYLFPDLSARTYNLTVSTAKFQTKTVDRIELPVAETVSVNVQLALAEQSTSTEVTASQVILETASSALVSVADSKTVMDIPINGRDYRQMFLLAPGVAGVNSPNNPSFNGTRTEEINYQIDGVDDNDGLGFGEPRNVQLGMKLTF
jgi:hypothetical protein